MTDSAKFFEDNLKHIEAATNAVCARRGIFSDDAEEFSSHVKLKLIENDYRIISSFEGKSSLRTYLHTVINRLFIDLKRHEQKRWRASEGAKRMGEIAVKLEELICKQSYPFEEAYTILCTNNNMTTPINRDEAYEIALKLRERTPVPHNKNDEEALSRTPSDGIHPDEAILKKEFSKTKTALEEVVSEIESDITPEDRLMLKMKFKDNFKVSEIARGLSLERVKVDRRIKSILTDFKKEILKRGFNINDVMDAINNLGI